MIIKILFLISSLSFASFGNFLDKPNIIFILLDDLGKEWISCYGGENIETPHIDKLASSGIKFSNVYSMPQCTPSRVCFLTGQYPFRNGWVNHWDVPRWGLGYFDWKTNPSIARVMKSAGYKTAIAGKWQINDFRIHPDALIKHGFDDFCMWTGGETDLTSNEHSLKFDTTKDLKDDFTQFYKLAYKYETDCLSASFEYQKTFYNDGNLEPDATLKFLIKFIPFHEVRGSADTLVRNR